MTIDEDTSPSHSTIPSTTRKAPVYEQVTEKAHLQSMLDSMKPPPKKKRGQPPKPPDPLLRLRHHPHLQFPPHICSTRRGGYPKRYRDIELHFRCRCGRLAAETEAAFRCGWQRRLDVEVSYNAKIDGSLLTKSTSFLWDTYRDVGWG